MDQDCSGGVNDVALTDTFADRATVCLGSLSTFARGDLTDATEEQDEPVDSNGGRSTVWGSFVASSGAPVTVCWLLSSSALDQQSRCALGCWFASIACLLRAT